MDDIFYLIHSIDKYNDKINELNILYMTNNQYPGVYFYIITKDNIDNENINENNYILIFSKKLLEQKNYHINIIDYNGFNNKKYTYYPWNLHDAIKHISTNIKNGNIIGNEVIFYDPVPIDYLCLNINISYLPSNISINSIIPKISIENNIKPDINKIPFYCYNIEKNYDIIYKKMALICNINKKKSFDNNINEIKKKILELDDNNKKIYKVIFNKKIIIINIKNEFKKKLLLFIKLLSKKRKVIYL